MRSQTFLGQAYQARSKNLADQLCINLFLNPVDSTGAKAEAGLFGTPGLDRKAALPTGPVRGEHVLNGTLYVVAGATVYAVDSSFSLVALGAIGSSSGPVSWIDNGAQAAFFDGTNGYLVPGGRPLQSAALTAGGANYNAGDTITLVDANGPSPATAQLTVDSVSGGAVTAFSITIPGAFTDAAPVLTQSASSGSGGGFTIGSIVLGPSVGVYKLALPFTNPTIANYQDGFGVCVEGGTTTAWQSNLFDLSIWDPLNFSDVEARPSNLVAIGFLHRQLIMLQETTLEFWVNVGANGFVFAEQQGVHLEVGCAAPYSVMQAGESLIWLAQTEQGRNVVAQMTGYEAIEISTDAVEYAIAQYSTISDAIAYVYRMEKRVFYVLTFPTANVTWACEVSGKTRTWHQWLYFSNGAYSRHLSNCATFFNGQTIVGDYRNGNLYLIDLDTYTDDAQPIRRSRSWRALGAPTEVPVRFKYLWIDMQSGVGVDPNANPQMMLDFSDDGGYSWSAERFGAAGKTGEYGNRVKFNRLGSTSRGQGEDRIWRISTDDKFAVAMMGAYQG